MKLITILLLTHIYCTISHGAFLAKTNLLFNIESKALEEKINYNDYRKFALAKDDDFKTTFYKLALQYRCFKEAKENFGNMGKQLMRDSKIAHQKFPNSPEIAMYYFRMNAIFNRDTKNFQFADMVGLIPYINCSKDVPGIPRVMVSIIQDRISNLKNILPKNGYTFQRYATITGGRTFEEIKQRLELLADYWILQIDPEYSTRWTKKKIDKVRQKMTYTKRQEAIGIWKNIIRECNIGYIDDLRMKFRNEFAAEQFKRNEVLLKQRNKYLASKLSKEIKELEKKLMTPIKDYKKIMNIFAFLQGNKKQLQNYKHVPGYKNLLKRYKGSEEAQILDAAFFIYATGNYKKALTILEELKCKDTNVKALFFRIYATLWANSKSTQSVFKALILANKILELNPKNEDAKILKIRLKVKQKEYSIKN